MSVGAVLTEARERAGLTIDDVSELTRIRRTLVADIERDDYHSCGGDFYARGHIKSIAHAVHIDPAPLLAEFDGEHRDPDLPTASGILDVGRTGEVEHDAVGRRPNWSLLMAVVLVGVVAFGAFHLVTSRGSSSASNAGSDPGTTSGAPATSPTAAASSTTSAPPDAIAELPARGVTVELTTVSGKSWVSATGKTAGVLYQSVLGPDSTQTLRDDRQVRLVLGNAGAVHLVVNGRDLGTPGSTGEVVRLTFGPGDPSSAGG